MVREGQQAGTFRRDMDPRVPAWQLINIGIGHAMVSLNLSQFDQPLIARTEADAPDVDARVILSKPAPVGEFVGKRITGSRGYDLLA